jgi:predicted nucleotidyltransferase
MAFVSFRTDAADSAALKVSAARQGISLQKLLQGLVSEHLAKAVPTRLADVVSVLRSRKADLEKRGVVSASVFGSTARGEERSDSDIDIVIDVAPEARMSLTGFAVLQSDLQDLLGSKVDLVEWRNLEPRLLASVRRDAVRVF